MRFSLTTLYGSNFEGNHLSTEGNAADGSSVAVPLYRHEVSLDLAHVELGLQYTIATDWDLLARIPWEEKRQQAGIALVDAATPSEVEAMRRNIDIHHRSITLRGFSDLMFLGRHRSGPFTFAGGVTVPTGHTIEDPYALGDRGIQHLHIQFGTGTFDPLFEASYTRPAFGATFATRLPLYENKHGFQAPPDGTLSAYASRRVSERWQLRLEGALYGQGYGHWNGERDENSGMFGTSIAAGATVKLRDVFLSADVRYPIAQRTLHEGDAFTQGPMFVVSVSGALRQR